MTQDWTDAYANMAHIPGSAALPQIWAQAAADYRATRRIDADIAYGSSARERFDLVWPDGLPRGLVVFVHGGYWMATAKSDWTHYAEGARAAGWAVCMVDYDLAPTLRIADITRQIGAAITRAADLVPGPIRLAGHSAGGHLACRMICQDTALSAPVIARIEHTLSISGLHDLRPLMWTAMNATLHLDEDEVRAESPALLRPISGQSVTAWVGGGERPEFLRQARLLQVIWSGLGAAVDCRIDGQHHHFSVLDGMLRADSDLTRALLGQVTLART